MVRRTRSQGSLTTNSFPYIDDMFRRGAVRVPTSMHLNYRDGGSDQRVGDGSRRGEMSTLDDVVLSDAMLVDGLRVLDVGCGLGGTLHAIAREYDAMDLIGLTIDPRQVVRCAELVPPGSSTMQWLCGDAVRLPFTDNSMDRVVSVEAAPHFLSRTMFLAEASRVLRPGGRLVGTDMSLALDPDATLASRNAALSAIRMASGTWPDPFARLASVYAPAQQPGLKLVSFKDITAETADSYGDPGQPDTPLKAGIAHLGSMHRAGELRCVRFAFEAVS